LTLEARFASVASRLFSSLFDLLDISFSFFHELAEGRLRC
jgi:hypothetical protein